MHTIQGYSRIFRSEGGISSSSSSRLNKLCAETKGLEELKKFREGVQRGVPPRVVYGEYPPRVVDKIRSTIYFSTPRVIFLILQFPLPAGGDSLKSILFPVPAPPP